MSSRVTSALLAVPLALLAAGCTGETVTQIVVSIATDLEIPQQLAAFDFEVYTQDAPPNDGGTSLPAVRQTFDVDPDVLDYVTLPNSIGLFPAGDPTRPIHIIITGRKPLNKEEIIWREARLAFTRDRIVLVQMNLLQSCIARRCPPGQTCKAGGVCEDIDEVDPPFLPADFRPPGLDGTTSPPDGRFDAGVEDLPPDAAPSDLPTDIRPGDLAADAPPADQQIPDGPLGDLPADAPPPDLTADAPPQPDLPLQPDTLPPDQQAPDGPLADSAPTDTTPPADTFLGQDASIPVGCANGWCTFGPTVFQMGSPTAEACRDADERLHEVTLTYYYEIGQYEVSQGEWVAIFGADPSADTSCGATCPVERVSWHMAADYCNRLSQPEGLTPCYSCSGSGAATYCEVVSPYSTKLHECPGYRLPTEAEWENAARAGEAAALHNGQELSSCTGADPAADAIAWYVENSRPNPSKPPEKHPAGTRTPNAAGVHDMAGNVGEWIADGYFGAYSGAAVTDPYYPPAFNSNCLGGAEQMVGVRSGRFDLGVSFTRSANRGSSCKHYQIYANRGFRCARRLTGTN